MARFIVYGLFDPRTQELRYVGKSCQGLKRPRKHSAPSQLKKQTHTARWCSELAAQRLRPEIEVLEEHLGAETLYDAEQFFIAYFRSIGCRLTNHVDGGRGALGLKHTPEAKARISAAHRGKVVSLDSRARISTAKLGIKKGRFAEKHRRAIAAANGAPFKDDLGCRWVSQREAARFYKLHAQNISACLKGRIRQTGGRTFFYEVSHG